MSNSKFKNHPYSILLIFVLLLFFLPGKAQLNEDYTPIKLKGEIPIDFIKRVRGETKINLSARDKTARIYKQQFRAATQYALKSIFQNGNIYFNDPLTAYVRKVGKHLLYKTPWSSKITIFISRFGSLNATSWQDGTIIINIGLLSRLENEAQLAFVLAHEISHFAQQHHYRQFAQVVKNNAANSKTLNASWDYVLDFELEADSMAMEILKNANYDYTEGRRVLKIIKGEYARTAVDFESYLESNRFTIRQNHLCKNHQYFDYMDDESHKIIEMPKTKMDKRYFKMLNIAKRDDVKPNLRRYILPASLFKKAVTIAQFELVEQAFRESNYLRSIYEALVLLNQYQDNRYLHIKVAENLYYINAYNDLSIINRLFFDTKKIAEDDYANLCCFVNKLSKRNLQEMVYGFVQEKYQKFPADERMLIVMAKTVESVFQITTAKPFYLRYVKNFPDGKHILLAKKKSK